MSLGINQEFGMAKFVLDTESTTNFYWDFEMMALRGAKKVLGVIKSTLNSSPRFMHDSARVSYSDRVYTRLLTNDQVIQNQKIIQKMRICGYPVGARKETIVQQALWEKNGKI